MNPIVNPKVGKIFGATPTKMPKELALKKPARKTSSTAKKASSKGTKRR